MIQINFFHDDQGHLQSLELTGHAGYAEAGSDIVCAAVSSQVISVENSLVELLNIPVETQVNETEGGYLKITLPERLSKQSHHDSQVILRHLEFALEILAEHYPEYININKS